MSLRHPRRTRLLLGGAALLASVSVGGTAFASTVGHSTAPVASKHHHRGVLARSDHTTLEVKRNGSWITLDIDRGSVSAVSSSSITLLRPDGQRVTEAITSTTKFKGVTSASQVVVGKVARVVSEDGSALRIRQHVSTPTS